VKGYKAQAELVMGDLSRLLVGYEARGESAIVEGVHLNLSLVMALMERHPAVVPFLVTIKYAAQISSAQQRLTPAHSNEEKHRERFAVRAKYMSLAPEANRYIRYFRQIRTIQDYLAVRATRLLVPCVNNTNVDRSVQTIHATFFGCLRRGMGASQSLSERAMMLHDEYRKHTQARSAWSSKSMLAFIRGRHGLEPGPEGAEAAAEADQMQMPVHHTPSTVAGASSCDDAAPLMAHVAVSDGGASVHESVHESSAVSCSENEEMRRTARLATLDEDSPRREFHAGGAISSGGEA